MKPTLPLRGVLLDWAGTTIDYGSLAPTWVFLEIFRRRGVELTTDEARGPMGRAKLDHIAAVASVPRVGDEWRRVHGRSCDAADVQAMYADFLPLQKATLARKSDMIPGVPEAIDDLRRRGLKIGSSTGYTRELMDIVAPLAAAQGYSPDVVLCADDVPAGRPAPWMNFQCAQQLGIYPMSSILVVDDTVVGIQAAKSAGAYAVAVSQTGNGLGLSLEETTALPAAVLEQRLALIEREFRSVGADAVIRSVADLPWLVDALVHAADSSNSGSRTS